MLSYDTFQSDAEAAIAAATDLAQLESVRVDWLGRKGTLTTALRGIHELPEEERPQAGAELQNIRAAIEAALEARQAHLQQKAIEEKVAQEQSDITLPGRYLPPGARHPTLITMRRICRWFAQQGFREVQGPEIEDDHHNFNALNIPPAHPARAMHDTFYMQDEYLLRTHTSPVQIRAMAEYGAPIRAIAPGRVYRCDSDPTHSPMFHQVEGLCVGTDITMSQLKYVVVEFLQDFFAGRDIEVRFRASYFPFTEPSAEVDVRHEHSDWLEVLGCGMVHPNVLRSCDIDPEEHGGFAFGMGVERLAMLYYNIPDLRVMFANDLRFLRQFGGLSQ